MPEPTYTFTEEELQVLIYYAQLRPHWDLNKIIEKVAIEFDWTK